MVADLGLKQTIESLEASLKQKQRLLLQESNATHKVLDETYKLKREIAQLKHDLSMAVIQKDEAQNDARLREREIALYKGDPPGTGVGAQDALRSMEATIAQEHHERLRLQEMHDLLQSQDAANRSTLEKIEEVVRAFYDEHTAMREYKDMPLNVQVSALYHEVGKMYKILETNAYG